MVNKNNTITIELPVEVGSLVNISVLKVFFPFSTSNAFEEVAFKVFFMSHFYSSEPMLFSFVPLSDILASVCLDLLTLALLVPILPLATVYDILPLA